MKNMSIDNLIELYRHGYRLEEHTSIASLSNFYTPNFSNVHTLQGSLLDPITNFGKVIVSSCTGDCTAAATEVTVDDGTKFPDPATDGAFNLIWWNSTDYPDPSDDPNKEVIRCTAKSGNILTITRAQEGTSASTKNSSGKVYKMILSLTAKMISDISGAITTTISTHSSTTSSVHGFDASGNAPAQVHGISRHTGTIGTWANIDKTISSIADITAKSHTSLTDIGSNTHAQIDTAITASIGHIAANGTSVHNLGTMSTQAANNVSITGGSITNITGLTVSGTIESTTGGIKFPDATVQTTAAATGGIMAFGNGVDGDVTISGDTTLTRDMYYNNLTINSGITLTTDSFRIFVKNTLTNNGIIDNSGVSVPPSTGTGGAGRSDKTLRGSSNGGNGSGGAGSPGAGGGGGGGVIVVVAKTLINNNLIKTNGGNGGDGYSTGLQSGGAIGGGAGGSAAISLGGAGGKGSDQSGAGGAGGTVTPARFLPNNFISAILGSSGMEGYIGGGGGGGAGGRNNVTKGAGGGGGGGVVILVYNSKSGGGTITVTGGSGGAAPNNGVANGNNGNVYEVPI